MSERQLASARPPAPTVEILSWSGCPSHDAAIAQLRRVLEALDRSDAEVTTRWIETDDAAQQHRFLGSPSYRVGGHELIEVGENPVFALNCRVYLRRDGRFSPLPDDRDVAEALSAHLPAALPTSGSVARTQQG